MTDTERTFRDMFVPFNTLDKATWPKEDGEYIVYAEYMGDGAKLCAIETCNWFSHGPMPQAMDYCEGCPDLCAEGRTCPYFKAGWYLLSHFDGLYALHNDQYVRKYLPVNIGRVVPFRKWLEDEEDQNGST